jgi:Nuclease-related domain
MRLYDNGLLGQNSQMLIKSADDQSRHLQLLEDLQSSPLLAHWQKDKLREHIQRKRIGLQGERDAAHYIDTYLADGANHAILHDLRLEVGDMVAQIDHLIIGRGFHFFLLETKNFGGNLSINAAGEFTVAYGREKFGIESPIEQSKRHEVVLLRVLNELGIVGRLRQPPKIFHAVLLHPRALISRPPSASFDTSNIMKADQFETWRQKTIDSIGVASVLGLIANIASQDTIAEWGKLLAARHRPNNPLNLPEWLKPQAPKPVPSPTFAPVAKSPPPPVYRAAPPTSAKPEDAERRRLICATCGAKISFPEGKFCWNNEKRFGGSQYCREHQKAF